MQSRLNVEAPHQPPRSQVVSHDLWNVQLEPSRHAVGRRRPSTTGSYDRNLIAWLPIKLMSDFSIL